MQIPLVSKTDYTQNGNKYTKTRLGAVITGTGFALGTNLKINNYRKTPEYAAFLQKTAERLKTQLKDFNPEILKKSVEQGQKTTKYGAIASMTLVGVLAGSVIDSVINSKKRKAADKNSV